MGIQKHTHRLKRHRYKSGNTVFFCTLPDCNFKIETALALGKKCLCHCGNEFILNEYQVRLARPHCDNCSKIKVKGADGKKHFVRKSNITTDVTNDIAADTNETLRNRLSTVVNMEDEDLL